MGEKEVEAATMKTKLLTRGKGEIRQKLVGKWALRNEVCLFKKGEK